uniref:Uncharacterized protein n=1 Tax=Cacopsylla melanoneura TaxID=428564 RepID=A0A8D9BI22_9HEMI
MYVTYYCSGISSHSYCNDCFPNSQKERTILIVVCVLRIICLFFIFIITANSQIIMLQYTSVTCAVLKRGVLLKLEFNFQLKVINDSFCNTTLKFTFQQS